MHICKAGLHCTTLVGLTADGRCAECRRLSHRQAQANYRRTPKGAAARDRYRSGAAGMLADVRHKARQRGGS